MSNIDIYTVLYVYKSGGFMENHILVVVLIDLTLWQRTLSGIGFYGAHGCVSNTARGVFFYGPWNIPALSSQ